LFLDCRINADYFRRYTLSVAKKSTESFGDAPTYKGSEHKTRTLTVFNGIVPIVSSEHLRACLVHFPSEHHNFVMNGSCLLGMLNQFAAPVGTFSSICPPFLLPWGLLFFFVCQSFYNCEKIIILRLP